MTVTIRQHFVRILLILCGFAALASISAAFYFKGPDVIETWLVVAAALAVLTSLLSAWASLVTVEMQERQLRPEVTVYMDVADRYQLLQVRMENVGRSSTFNIQDNWSPHILDSDGEAIAFCANEQPVTVLHPGQRISRSIDVFHTFRERYRGEKYKGYVRFEDAVGRRYKSDFVIDPRQYYAAKNLLYDQEDVRTQYEIQQIPRRLGEINGEIKKLVAVLRYNMESKSSGEDP